METEEEFKKKRKRGIIILNINFRITILLMLFIKSLRVWWMYVYLIISAIMLVKRINKNRPSETDNYIFGETLGNKMQKTPMKFILEAQMMALVFMTLGLIATTILSIFFSELALIWKIVISVNALFGIIFLLMILINTFQSYKAMQETEEAMRLMTEAVQEVNQQAKEKGLNGN